MISQFFFFEISVQPYVRLKPTSKIVYMFPFVYFLVVIIDIIFVNPVHTSFSYSIIAQRSGKSIREQRHFQPFLCVHHVYKSRWSIAGNFGGGGGLRLPR